MADVGLDAELILAIDAALAQVGVIETALNAATTSVPVDLDYLSTVDSFSQALAGVVADVSATPVDIPVAADTTAAETSIGALAEAPPVDVPVDANTTDAVTSIEALASVMPSIDIPIEADTTGAATQLSDLGAEATVASEGVVNLETSVTGLGAAAGIAEGSAKELVATVGELGGEGSKTAAAGILGLSAVTAGFFEEGMNAVSAGQRFDTVLGDMGNKIKEIDVNGMTTSMEDLGIKFGSTGAEMENVNSKLFQMAVNSGATKEQAVQFTQQVETLGARAISLNPQLGSLADVTDALGTKIGRGGRFAAQYGLDLNAAEISARALADTQKMSTSELTFAEKAIAGAELASEKYGTTLAGTVAQGQKNAAVTASELKARFKEAIEQIGVPIVAPVLDLIKQAEPDAILIAEALGRLAKDALPAVSAALMVIEPPLHLISALLSIIPDGVVSATAAFFGLRFAMEAVAQAAIADEVALTALSTAIPWLAAITAGIILVQSVMGGTPAYADEMTQAVDTAAKGLSDFTVATHETVLAEIEAASNTAEFGKALREAGVSNDQLVESLLAGGDAYQQYTVQILVAAEANGAGFDSAVKLTNELEHLKTSTEAGAQSTLDAAVNSGKLSAADRDAAVQKAGLIGGNVNYVAALAIVQPELKKVKDATDAQAKADADAKKAADDHAKALHEIQGQNIAVAMTMENVRTMTGDQTAALAGLALALGDANLASKNFDAVATELGVSTEQLKKFVADVTKEIDGFVTTAMNGLPSVKTAIDDVLNPKTKPDKPIVIDPAKLQAEIDDSINKINGFNMELKFLVDSGYNNLAMIAGQRGPEFTDALVKSIQGTDLGGPLDAKFGELNAITAAEGPKLREAGTSIVLGTGQVAADAAKIWGDKFQLGPGTDSAISGANTEIDGWAHVVPAAVGAVGVDAADKWEQGFGKVDVHTATALGDAVATIDAKGALVHTSAASTAQAGAEGFATGIAGVPGSASSAMSSAAANIESVTSQVVVWQAWSAGDRVGVAFDQGLAHGIGSLVESVTTAATRVVDDAEAAARRAAQTHSPSKVWEAIGLDMTAGLASGLAAGAGLATDAAGRIVEGATMTTAATVRPMAPVVVPGGLTTNPGSGDPVASKLHDVLNRLERQLANLAPVHVSADRPLDLALAQAVARQVVDQRWRFGQ